MPVPGPERAREPYAVEIPNWYGNYTTERAGGITLRSPNGHAD